ncbi:hypothetical protein JNB91_29050 [Rhizobium wenxiniae]|uniref:hypothetical protein n=1 Tax=Rhizobium wenxiniae TaxID=1737357 RepID=UPI001C6F2A40|nr:hypothetical protein [Rhizobium wenxiniae]MBW9091831.1 hypothetical protein [Rhizobium wenxiniae]
MAQQEKAASGMMLFVVLILVAALGLAALYFFVLTPGSPDSSTIQRPQEGTLEQHTR